MEVIEFSYLFDDENNGDSMKVIIKKEDADARELCKAFVDFMTAVGFSETNVYDYFNKAKKNFQ